MGLPSIARDKPLNRLWFLQKLSGVAANCIAVDHEWMDGNERWKDILILGTRFYLFLFVRWCQMVHITMLVEVEKIFSYWPKQMLRNNINAARTDFIHSSQCDLSHVLRLIYYTEKPKSCGRSGAVAIYWLLNPVWFFISIIKKYLNSTFTAIFWRNTYNNGIECGPLNSGFSGKILFCNNFVFIC